MRRVLAFIIFHLCVNFCSVASAYPSPNATCAAFTTDSELSVFLKSKKEKRASIIYARADWAVSSRVVNDVYVPSIAFLEVLGDVDCVVVDVTKSGGADVMKRFDYSGVPFFAIVDFQGNLIARKAAAVEFTAFKSWFQSVTQGMRPAEVSE